MTAATLTRTHFSIGRAAEYFDAKELAAQTGRPRHEFAAVVLKELVDNALDAAETAGVAPEIGITVAVDDSELTIAVADNGSGLAPETLIRILDFDTRTSDKNRYRSPTRGAQGNALKTVVGIPTALGSTEPIVIESCGTRHTIRPKLDLAGNVDVGHAQDDGGPTVGTSVTVTLPAAGQTLWAGDWGKAFALCNPHAFVKIAFLDRRSNRAQPSDDEPPDFYEHPPTVEFPGTWTKWLPTDPTSPHWYNEGALQSLIDAEIAYGRASGAESKLLRPFVAEFRGLSSTVKTKQVCGAVPQAKRLADLNGDTSSLLAAMRSASAPAKPAALGWIGKEHVREVFDREYGIVGDQFWYRRVEQTTATGIPFVVEAAVAATDDPGGLVTAINFSPTFTDPLANSYLACEENQVYGHGVRGFLGHAHVLPLWEVAAAAAAAAAAAFVHIVCPALVFLDRGKTSLDPPPELTAAMGQALWRVSKALWREGERAERDAAAAERRHGRQARPVTAKISVKDAVWAVMEAGWAETTDDGAKVASNRTLFYHVRPLMQRYAAERGLTVGELTPTYFGQRLLPRYQREVRKLPRVYYEPRGTLYEPHTGETVDLGTLQVEGYHVPDWTYDKILFVEKQGLWPVLEQARLAERYDMAIVAGQGFATVAARVLLARASTGHDIRIFVAHDADPSGYNICRTIREETDRMPDHRIDVVDIGLTVEDARDLGLQTETYPRLKKLPADLVLTDLARTMFEGKRQLSAKGKVSWIAERVELNAFTSAQLIAYIEDGLAKAGATAKVVPDAATIERETVDRIRDGVGARLAEWVADAIDLDALADRLAAGISPHPDRVTPEAIRRQFETNRVIDWRTAAATWAGLAVSEADAAIVQAVRAAIEEAIR
jgi:Histidine kinase-, DNA gyrase B-, and HSP90-like ATPase